MAGKNLVKAIVLGTALLTGANAYAQSKPDVIATIEYPSKYRDDFKGKLQYKILSDGTAYQADKPNVKLDKTYFWDIDGDGEFGDAEIKAIKDGNMKVIMHKDFNEMAESESKRILENLVVSLNFDRLNEPQKPTQKESKPNPESMRGYSPLNNLNLPENTYNPKLNEPKIQKEKVKPVWSLIAGVNANSDWDKYGLSFGARVNPFRNEKIGLGLTADLGFGKDEQVESQRIKLSREKEFVGEINEIDNRSFGLSAEMQLYNFIFGGGFDYCKHISETNEKVIRGEEVLESNTNSVPDGKVYGKGYLGLEFQPTKNFGIGATIGYHGKNGIQFGLRNTLKLNKRK